MSSEMLDWVYECLLEDEDIVVPLKKIWSRRYGSAGEPSFERFARAVLSDRRFELLYALDHDPLLEAFGYLGGPRVKLRSRHLPAQCVVRIVQKHNERIVQVLRRAIEVLAEESNGRPDEDLHETILMLEGLRPLFKPWVHLNPEDPAR